MADNKWGWTYKRYTRWQFKWCRHCGERIELKRVGSGRISRDSYRGRPQREWGTGYILRDYRYEPTEAHECEGTRKESESLRKQNEYLTRVLMPQLNVLVAKELRHK